MTAPLQPEEGLTTVLSFPKGLFVEPTREQRLQWMLNDNRAALIALAGLIVMLASGLMRWRKVGRDPKAGPVVVEYDPPDDLSPATLRYIEKTHIDTRGFSADVLSLAVAGHVDIHRDEKVLKQDDWRVQRAAAAGCTLAPDQTALLTDLFADGDSLTFHHSNATRMQRILGAHQVRIKTAMATRFPGGLYRYNGGSIAWMALLLAVFSIATLVFGVGTGSGLLLAAPLLVAMVVVFLAFVFLLPTVTPEGRRMRDRIEGFRRYLTVADKQDLQRLQAPGADAPTLDAGRFEFLLPYAVALQVEDAWTKKFTAAVGASAAAAATASIGWYYASGLHGGAGIGDMAGFSKAIGSGFTGQIASSASPPGSSSGSGGGGFSGGGGGGGGGGGR
ncbi:DUF2207 domain-containing protein [Luteimonas fraxinea]|uniref:DUF2207 domain-containing protein n=1 Tax=Luteimonas fraxinea TaxID=2901869 RepID=UPI0022835026|nr:DUF2207 domain-containing protein [Luteimonas fraxinea]